MYIQENSLNPKQFFAKSSHLQEKSLNPKQFFAKSNCLQEFEIKHKSILPKKMKKKIQKNVSHTSKKCPLNVHPRKFFKPKTIFSKIKPSQRNVLKPKTILCKIGLPPRNALKLKPPRNIFKPNPRLL